MEQRKWRRGRTEASYHCGRNYREAKSKLAAAKELGVFAQAVAQGVWQDQDGELIFSHGKCLIRNFGRRWHTLVVDGDYVKAAPTQKHGIDVRVDFSKRLI